MSTQIKNTLFRFVTMRAPQLTNEEKQNERFIFRNKEGLKGFFSFFDEAVAAKPIEKLKWEAMKDATTTFSYLNVDGIKTFNTKLYELGVWLSKNRSTLTQKELNDKIVGCTAINDIMILVLLWDNLFYQTLTQKDFYCKEAIIHLLVANHFITLYNKTDFEQAKRLINAKVVFPKSLFIEDEVTNSSVASKTLINGDAKETVASDEMLSQQKRAATVLQNEQLKKLSKELKVVQRKYQKEYQAAYEKAKTAHLIKIKPIQEEYEAKLEEARKTSCAVRDPQSTFDPKDPCQQPAYVQKPEYPEFNFSYKDGLDSVYLSENLTTESFDTLIELSGKEIQETTNQSKVDPLSISFTDIFENYEEVEQQITTQTTTNQEIINENTLTFENTNVVIGGVVITIPVPVTNVFGYTLCPKQHSLRKFFNCDMSIQLPDASWNISRFEYTVEKTTGNYTNNGNISYTVSKVGNGIYLNNIAIGNPTSINEPEITGFKGKITFTNGKKMSFSVTSFNLHQCFTGKLIEENPDDTTGGTTDEFEVFIPSGFGVKQLGIADYKKVEQTTHSYIEGEVSHIENIMAREYKDKTTRKLRKNELTTSVTNESEHEKLTDTSSTSRFEMQNEVAQVLQESKDFYANANVSYAPTSNLTLGASTGFATNNSKENSTRQAITEAKEITEKALDRMVTKVKQERIEKIIEEFEETNSHGFDNRKGDKHVVGVYRWVDKIYKNQIVNYGKRLMFEFMIPQPAKLHQLGMELKDTAISKIVEPLDPRTYDADKNIQLKDYASINENTVKFWASKFNVELPDTLQNEISIGKSFSFTTPETQRGEYDEVAAGSDEVKIPENYNVIGTKANFYITYEPGDGLAVFVGGKRITPNQYTPLSNFNGTVPVSYSVTGHHSGSVSIELKCVLTNEAKKKWQQETFKAIIDAYLQAKKEYQLLLESEAEKGKEIKTSNPGFYREFENKVLRKNCISYIISQNPKAKLTYGRDDLTNNENSFEKYEVKINESLDQYASFVKFIEQAFEWDILSYNLYPFYWGNRQEWRNAYQFNESQDALFRNFMQAGMARVIVSVRPGFEEAVRYYMQTGQIWNGGEVPVIEDPMYLSIVDELTDIKPDKEGKAWWSRVPTAMTILQADNIGLKVNKALPENDDLEDFEDPNSVPKSQGFSLSDAQLGGETTSKTARLVGAIEGSEGISSKIVLKRIEGGIEDLTYSDEHGKWELNHLPSGRYELLIDTENDFPTETFFVAEGSKEQVVELANDQTVEIHLVIKRV
jgi:hypothetical protein